MMPEIIYWKVIINNGTGYNNGSLPRVEHKNLKSECAKPNHYTGKWNMMCYSI